MQLWTKKFERNNIYCRNIFDIVIKIDTIEWNLKISYSTLFLSQVLKQIVWDLFQHDFVNLIKKIFKKNKLIKLILFDLSNSQLKL